MSSDAAMMSEWSVYGNRLLFLDALSAPAPSEDALFDLARVSLKRTGADSLIVLQRGNARELAALARRREHWMVPASEDLDAMVRILEPDGSESLSCGNGLLSAAALMRKRGENLPARVLTGVASDAPWVVEIGVREGERPWLRHEHARRVTDDLYVPPGGEPEAEDCMDLVRDLGAGADGNIPPGLVGRLVLTGEPHLVIFADQVPGMRESGFCGAMDWLPALGRHLNFQRRDMFPEGVNVDLVLGGGPEDGVRYRCFERGVNHETGACGTGAMAVASVWRAVRGRGIVDALRVQPSGAPAGNGYMVRFGRGAMLLSGCPLLQAEAVLRNPERSSLYSTVS